MKQPLRDDEYLKLKARIQLYLEIGRFDAAENTVRSALENAPDSPRLLLLMGIIFHRQSRFVEAVDFFRKALAALPSYMEAALNLSITLNDLGQYQEAEQVIEQCRPYQGQTFVDHLIAQKHLELGELHYQKGAIAEAIMELRKALQYFPQLIEARVLLAKIHSDTGDQLAARTEYEALLTQTKSDGQAWSYLAQTYVAHRDLNKAKEAWVKARSLNAQLLTPRICLDYMNGLGK